MVEDIQRLRMLSVLQCSAEQHFDLRIKQAYRNEFLEDAITNTETVNIIKRSHERALPCGKENIGGKPGWKDERTVKDIKSASYLIRNRIIIIMDEMT